MFIHDVRLCEEEDGPERRRSGETCRASRKGCRISSELRSSKGEPECLVLPVELRLSKTCIVRSLSCVSYKSAYCARLVLKSVLLAHVMSDFYTS